MIQPPIRRWCPGVDDVVHVPCPAGAELPVNQHNRKRCEACALRQKTANSARHWRQHPELQVRQRALRLARRARLAAASSSLLKPTKPCEGTYEGPCPRQAKIDEHPLHKRCRDCSLVQRRWVKHQSHLRHWPEYREQRKNRLRWLRQDLEDTHPRRAQLFRLAVDAGLLGRAA
jgi:hypothetical protein